MLIVSVKTCTNFGLITGVHEASPMLSPGKEAKVVTAEAVGFEAVGGRGERVQVPSLEAGAQLGLCAGANADGLPRAKGIIPAVSFSVHASWHQCSCNARAGWQQAQWYRMGINPVLCSGEGVGAGPGEAAFTGAGTAGYVPGHICPWLLAVPSSPSPQVRGDEYQSHHLLLPGGQGLSHRRLG